MSARFRRGCSYLAPRFARRDAGGRRPSDGAWDACRSALSHNAHRRRGAPPERPATGVTMIRTLMRAILALTTIVALATPSHAQGLEKLVFSTDWLAEAEHGGFYQAVAEGTYRK